MRKFSVTHRLGTKGNQKGLSPRQCLAAHLIWAGLDRREGPELLASSLNGELDAKYNVSLRQLGKGGGEEKLVRLREQHGKK